MREQARSPWWDRRSTAFEIGVLILAFALRLLYLLEVRDNPFFENPTLDAVYHLEWAKQIADGAWWGVEPFFRAPFYPYLLAAFYKLTGGSLFAVRLLQHLVGVASVWGIYRLSRLVFSEGAAKITALAAAVYAPLIYFEDELLLDFLLVPWMLLALFAAHRIRLTGQRRWVILLGLIIGLFAITRPNILICLPVFGWWVWRHGAERGKHPSRFRHLVLLLVGLGIPLLPVTMHNILAGNDFVLIASQGGVNFFIGNNAEADGLSAAMPQPWGNTWELAEIHAYAETKEGRKLKPSEVSDFWLRQGLRWWASDPVAALKLTAKKALLLFTNTEVSNNQDIRFFWQSYAPVVRFLPLTFGLVAPLGLVGLIIAARRNPFVVLMLCVSAMYAVSVAAFFVPARFRLPLLPALFFGFGGFVAFFLGYLRRGNWRPVVKPASAALLLMVLSFAGWFRTQPPTEAQTHFQLGNAALRRDDLDQAESHFRRALSLQPSYPDAHLNLGVINLRHGLLVPAGREFDSELRSHPNSSRAYANLCTVRALQGRMAEAEKSGKEAIARDPGNPTALVGLSKIWWTMHRYPEAIALLESAPDVVRDSPVGRDALGGFYVQLGRAADAERTLIPLSSGQVKRQPRFAIDMPGRAEELGYDRLAQYQANASYNLGWMHAKRKNLDTAVVYFAQAINNRPDFDEAYANLGAAYIDLDQPDTALACFTTAARLDSTNAGYVFNLGIARLRLRDTAAAVGEFQRALELDPRFLPAKQRLAELTGRRSAAP